MLRVDSPSRLRRLAIHVVLCTLTTMGAACGPTDGVIGSPALKSTERTTTFEAHYDLDDGLWAPDLPQEDSVVRLGDPRVDASDGKVATLVFPGAGVAGARGGAGPGFATALTSAREFGYGTYRWRAAFSACDSREEAAQALLAYFNDGSDRDMNAITDNVEIDFQVLCSSPDRVYLNVFTDYEISRDSRGPARFRRLSRVVSLADGTVHDTTSASEEGFIEQPSEPALRLDIALTDGSFHEVGFEWREALLRFFVVIADSERTLWVLTDRARIPTPPVRVVYNVWHPDIHWFPQIGSAAYPARDVTLQVDWFRYQAAE